MPQTEAEMRAHVAALRAELAATAKALSRVTAERDKLRRAYDQIKEQLELLRRRIFMAKAERVDVTQLEIEFSNKMEEMVRLASKLQLDPPPDGTAGTSGSNDAPPGRDKPKGKGRRNLAAMPMAEERVEILDPVLEGTVERIGFEESSAMAYRRGGPVRVVTARAKYKETKEDGTTTIVTVPKPKELFRRGLLAPSLVAHILIAKYRFGLPFVRLSKMLAAEGLVLDDGTMCRYAEDAGATLGVIVDAAAAEAKRQAFCLATDATGVAIRPEPLPSGQRQACAKGHFFVVLADRDHVFFEYKPRHTSDAVCDMFRGYSGYILADAHCVYDALFRGDAVAVGGKAPDEVACWSHARRHFWEAAVATKDALAREALVRIRGMFQLEAGWASLPPSERQRRRQVALRPLLDDFFTWAEPHRARLTATRGLLASAFGYAIRQRDALRRFLDDGRLPMTNNASERALRGIAVGRKAWLFFGSDDHAQAAANLFSLIASCQLHRLDPESYLTEIFRVLPYWPRDRYLELAPKYWSATRARLVEGELALPIGHITVPPASTPEEKPAAG
jgi:transposase